MTILPVCRILTNTDDAVKVTRFLVKRPNSYRVKKKKKRIKKANYSFEDIVGLSLSLFLSFLLSSTLFLSISLSSYIREAEKGGVRFVLISFDAPTSDKNDIFVLEGRARRSGAYRFKEIYPPVLFPPSFVSIYIVREYLSRGVGRWETRGDARTLDRFVSIYFISHLRIHISRKKYRPLIYLSHSLCFFFNLRKD